MVGAELEPPVRPGGLIIALPKALDSRPVAQPKLIFGGLFAVDVDGEFPTEVVRRDK
jgi:hypothetical protein